MTTEPTAQPWAQLAKERPDLAEFGQVRIDGKVSYLATVRRSGVPRAHPVTPIIGAGRCFLFVEPASAKARDLRENGYYCIHCAMNDSSGSSGEFQMTGRARLIEDEQTWEDAVAVASYRPSSSYLLFELCVSEVVATNYRGGRPSRRRWTPGEPDVMNSAVP